MSASTLRFRRTMPADAEAVRELTRAAYAKWVPIIGREPKPMMADYDRAIREHRIDMLFDGADLVGVVEMVDGADHLLIENVAVAPNRQGRGLGRALMAHAERTAAERGVAALRLYTNQRFAENIQFYRSLGFRIDRTEPFMGGMVVHMAKGVGEIPSLAP